MQRCAAASPPWRIFLHDFREHSLQGREAFLTRVERFGAFQVLLEGTCGIALLPIRTNEQFTGEQMLRIAIERLAEPDDHVVISTLIPERDRNEHVRERRSRVALETLQLQLESARQVTERFHQAAIMEVHFCVIRVDGEGALEAALRRGPIPFTEEHHLPQRNLCVGASIIQGKRAQRGGPGLPERFEVRQVANRRLCHARQRQTGVCRGVGWIDLCCRQKRRYGVGQLEDRPGTQMRPSAGDELGCLGNP